MAQMTKCNIIHPLSDVQYGSQILIVYAYTREQDTRYKIQDSFIFQHIKNITLILTIHNKFQQK